MSIKTIKCIFWIKLNPLCHDLLVKCMKYIKNGLNFAETVFTISQMLFKIEVLEPKSLYKSRARRHFYGTENDIWTGLAIMKKNGGWLWATFESVFFMFSGAKKIIKFFFLNIVVFALKSCIKWKWENHKKSIVYCSAEDTSLRYFYTMTLHIAYGIWIHQ